MLILLLLVTLNRFLKVVFFSKCLFLQDLTVDILCGACRKGNFVVVNIMIEHFPDHFMEKNSLKNTPLHEASKGGNKAIVELLVEKYTTQNLMDILSEKMGQNNEGLTPLHIACQEKHVDIVEIFFQINVDGQNKKKLTNARGKKDKTPLHYACRGGDLKIVECLLKNDADSLPNENGTFPIHVAARFGHKSLVECFIQNDKDKEDKYHNTPLNIATRYNQVDIIEFLMDR